MRVRIIVILSVLALTGCQTASMGTKEGAGTGLGAFAGGLAGSQIGHGNGKLVAVGAGALLGAFLGREIGASLDRADREYADAAATRAFRGRLREPVRWRNPSSGNSGTIRTLREGHDQAGTTCREYQQTIIVGGRTEKAFGTACRQPDGSWQILS